MKMRKNLLLDERAVARGEQAARERNLSLSALVERHLLRHSAHALAKPY
jgi:hypothetical protein